MTTIEDDIGVTKAKACEMLGINRAELNALIEQGELQIHQIGHYRRIPNYVLRDYLFRQHALQIVFNCVRTRTSLENLHGGRFPVSDTDDLSDIRVVGPHGEVPWNEVSRFGDDEMKTLMKEIVNNVFTVLASRSDELIDLPIPLKWDRPDWNPILTRKGFEEAVNSRYEEYEAKQYDR